MIINKHDVITSPQLTDVVGQFLFVLGCNSEFTLFKGPSYLTWQTANYASALSYYQDQSLAVISTSNKRKIR